MVHFVYDPCYMQRLLEVKEGYQTNDGQPHVCVILETRVRSIHISVSVSIKAGAVCYYFRLNYSRLAHALGAWKG